MTPRQGIQIDDVFIPGEIIVSVPTHTIQRDPRYFDKPLEFLPERWEGLDDDDIPFLPFSKGMSWKASVLEIPRSTFHFCAMTDLCPFSF